MASLAKHFHLLMWCWATSRFNASCVWTLTPNKLLKISNLWQLELFYCSKNKQLLAVKWLKSKNWLTRIACHCLPPILNFKCRAIFVYCDVCTFSHASNLSDKTILNNRKSWASCRVVWKEKSHFTDVRMRTLAHLLLHADLRSHTRVSWSLLFKAALFFRGLLAFQRLYQKH